MPISIILPAHQEGKLLQTTLSHLAQLDPAPQELIVVIDGEAEIVVPAMPFPVRCLRQAAAGPAAARNLGALAAGGDWLCFVDADVAVPPDFVAQAEALLTASPGLAAFIGSYDAQPGDPGWCSQYRNLLHHFTHQRAAREAATFWGACGLIEREVFGQIGGFDPRYRRPSVEDIELGYRLREAGHRIRLEPGWQVCHLKRWTLGEMLRTDIWQRALPWTELLLRYQHLGRMDLNLDAAGRWSGGLSLAGLGALLLGWPGLAFVMWGVMWGLNRRFYRFLAHRHSLRLALFALPLHLLYFCYSSLAFGWGWSRHLLRHRFQAYFRRTPLPS